MTRGKHDIQRPPGGSGGVELRERVPAPVQSRPRISLQLDGFTLRHPWTRYVKAVITALCWGVGLLKPAFDYVTGSIRTEPWLLVGACFFTLLLIRSQRVRLVVTTLLRGMPKVRPASLAIFRGPVAYASQDTDRFFGREREIELCMRGLEQYPFLLIDGESGTGKSSLVNAGLLPKLGGHYNLIQCRPTEDPLGRLFCAIQKEEYTGSRKHVTTRQVLGALGSTIGDEKTLIFIDQFEDLFITVGSRLQRRFMKVLRDAIRAKKLHLLVVVRSQFLGALVKACVDSDPMLQVFHVQNCVTIRPFSKERAATVLTRMLTSLYEGNPLLRQQLDDFVGALVGELLSNPAAPRSRALAKGSVLPVELQIVGMSLESLGTEYMSASKLRAAGGKVGMFRLYVDEAKEHVRRKAQASGLELDLVLQRLVKAAQSSEALTPEAIALQTRMSPARVQEILLALGDEYLVKQSAHADSVGGEGTPTQQRYALMHGYLAEVLVDVAEGRLHALTIAEERLELWQQWSRKAASRDLQQGIFGGRLRLLVMQPIPISVVLRLWRFARTTEHRRMLMLSLRGFASRLVLVLALFLAGLAVQEAYRHTDGYQIRAIATTLPPARAFGDSRFTLTECCRALILTDKADEAYRLGREGLGDSWVDAFCSVAGELLQMGVTERANQVLEKTLVLAHKPDDLRRGRSLAILSGWLTRFGRVEQAEALADEIDNPSDRSQATESIVIELIQRQNLTEAISQALAIRDDLSRAHSLRLISIALCKSGNCPQALELARSISDYDSKVTALAGIVETLEDEAASIRIVEEVRAVCRTIENPYQQCTILTATGQELIKAGRRPAARLLLDQALPVARSIKTESDQPADLQPLPEADLPAEYSAQEIGQGSRSRAFDRIVRALVSMHDFNAALIAAKEIDVPDMAIRSHAAIAEEMCLDGRITDASKLILTFEMGAFGSQALTRALKRLLNNRNFDTAMDVTVELMHLKWLGEHHDKPWVFPSWRDSPTETLGTIYRFDDRAFQRCLIETFAERLARSGDYSSAIKAAFSIDDASAGERALESIIKEMYRAGRWREAEQSARDHNDDRTARAFVALSSDLWLSGNKNESAELLAEAGKVAAAIQNRQFKERSLATVAEAYAQQRRFADALNLSLLLSDDDAKCESLSVLAEEVASAGDSEYTRKVFADALAATHTATAGSNQSRAFARIAKAFAQIHDYRSARLTADLCTQIGDRLEANAATLIEYAVQGNASLRIYHERREESIPNQCLN
jgi:hypothetical protein